MLPCHNELLILMFIFSSYSYIISYLYVLCTLYFQFRGIMTHASVDKETRERIGITDTLIRLSCGLEDIEDLITDIDQALTAAVSLLSTTE